MPCFLIIGTQVEFAPVELPRIVSVQEPGRIVDHVHVLVGKTLVRDVLHAGLDDEQIRVVAHGHRQLVVLSIVERRVYRGAVAILVIARFGPRAGIGDVNIACCRRHRAAGGDAIAIAAPENGDAAVGDHAVAGSENWRGAIHPDCAADAVSAGAYRRNARVHFDLADSRGVHIRQHGVHVVRAGRCYQHAVELGPHPLVRHAMDLGPAGDAAIRG